MRPVSGKDRNKKKRRKLEGRSREPEAERRSSKKTSLGEHTEGCRGGAVGGMGHTGEGMSTVCYMCVINH